MSENKTHKEKLRCPHCNSMKVRIGSRVHRIKSPLTFHDLQLTVYYVCDKCGKQAGCHSEMEVVIDDKVLEKTKNKAWQMFCEKQ